MEFTHNEFNKIKHEAEEIYGKIGSTYCPYFKEPVHFNSKGLDHLVFKKWNKTRLIHDQFMRFKYLKHAPVVIENSKTLQGIKTINAMERLKKNSKWQAVMKPVTYYEFIAILDTGNGKSRVKVIVKQIENNEKFFYSIIPFWGINKETHEKVLYGGNPEQD
jgi:hypothetical protein